MSLSIFHSMDGYVYDEYPVEVIGYHTWSYTDLLSWLNGYKKRYGFVYVDQDETMNGTLQRIPKDSYYWYKKVIQSNGEII